MNLTNSKETIQISEIKKHTSQSHPLRNINLKFKPQSASVTCTPGIYISARNRANKNPISKYMKRVLSSFMLLIKDLFGLLICKTKNDSQMNIVTISIVRAFATSGNTAGNILLSGKVKYASFKPPKLTFSGKTGYKPVIVVK